MFITWQSEVDITKIFTVFITWQSEVDITKIFTVFITCQSEVDITQLYQVELSTEHAQQQWQTTAPQVSISVKKIYKTILM